MTALAGEAPSKVELIAAMAYRMAAVAVRDAAYLDDADTDDVAQEALKQLYAKRQEAYGLAQVQTFLPTLIKRAVRDMIKQKMPALSARRDYTPDEVSRCLAYMHGKADRASVLPTCPEILAPLIDTAMCRSRLGRPVLSVHHRAIVLERNAFGGTWPDIAARLDVSEDVAERRYRRAVDRLTELVNERPKRLYEGIGSRKVISNAMARAMTRATYEEMAMSDPTHLGAVSTSPNG